MKTKLTFIFLIFGAFIFLGAGCLVQFNNAGGGAKADGGIFKSIDKGATWLPKSSLASVAGGKTIANINIKSLIMDPDDSKAIYALAAEGGVYYTYDAAESWNKISALGNTVVNAFLVDERNKCVLFSAAGNKVQKSIDCGRTWANVYLDSRVTQSITALAQNPFNGNLIYLGTSAGDLIKSLDSGASWSPVNVFPARITKIVPDLYESGTLYVGVSGRGVSKSLNNGDTWKDLSDSFSQYQNSNQIVDLVPSVATRDVYFHASRFGLLKTVNAGGTWQKIELLTPPGTTSIYSLAVDPKDDNIIYYSTGSTFYKSTDGGLKWVTKKLPTSRVAAALLIDPVSTGVIYMGALKLQK